MEVLNPTAELTFEDLRRELERIRGSMPPSTLYNQLAKLDIIPNTDGYYSLDDLEILKRLNRFLKQVPSIAKFRRALQLEMTSHAY